MKIRYLLLLILAIQFALGVLYTFATPLWQGHEQDYYTVVRFLDRSGRLPAASDYPAGDAEIRQATQPPLYFLLAYPIVALFDDDQAVPPGAQPTMICVGDGGFNAPVSAYPITRAYLPPVSGAVVGGYGLRLLNVVIGMIGVVFTYLAGRAFFPTRPSIALVAAALLAFEGNMVRLNTTISNDALLVTLAAANLLICALLAARFQWKTMALLLLCVGLALITRLGGWVLLAFDIPFILLIALLQWRTLGRKRARMILLGVGILVLLAVAVLIFNQITYGNFLGRYSGLADSISSSLSSLNLPWVTVNAVFNLTYSAYQEPLQALHPRAAFTTLYGVLLLVAFAGVLWGILRARAAERRAFLILLAMLLAAVALVVFRNALAATVQNTTLYNTGVVFAPLRYYAPGLPAAALLFSAGLIFLLPKRFPLSRLNLPGIVIAGCWLVVSALGGILALRSQPAFPVISPAAFAALPDLLPVEQAQPQSVPQLLSYNLHERPADGLVDLTLYLTTEQPLSLNYTAQVTLSAADNQPIPCDFIPARGVYPTTLWQPGEIIAAQATIPYCGAASPAPIELSLSWSGAAQSGEIVSQPESPPLLLATLSSGYVQAASCPGSLGVIADGYQLVKFNSPPTVHPGEVYLPSVNWLVLRPNPAAVTRTFTFTHVDTGTSYTCTGSPAPEYYNVALWGRGEEVFFDACPMTFPPEAPLGSYRVFVGITDAAGNNLPALTSSGQPVADGRIEVGEVTLAG